MDENLQHCAKVLSQPAISLYILMLESLNSVKWLKRSNENGQVQGLDWNIDFSLVRAKVQTLNF